MIDRYWPRPFMWWRAPDGTFKVGLNTQLVFPGPPDGLDMDHCDTESFEAVYVGATEEAPFEALMREHPDPGVGELIDDSDCEDYPHELPTLRAMIAGYELMEAELTERQVRERHKQGAAASWELPAAELIASRHRVNYERACAAMRNALGLDP